MKQFKVIGIMIYDRIKESGRTQKTLTKYGHCIKSRLGFHEVNEDVCSRVGMVILQLGGQMSEWEKLEEELNQIGGVQVKNMTFEN
ncbi:MAG: hypothetical protein JEZ03_01030 [Bacteroidales bacterium]|nr:hypothetical protein [Bacteroidales bacterium]